MAEYQTVSATDLEIDRLDADFYRPHYVANQRLLRTTIAGKLRCLSDVAKRMACGPFGSDLPSSLYRSQGIPLFRVQNVRDGHITEDGLVFLDDVTSESLNSCAFTGGNLLLAKSGLLGRVASVPMTIDRCNVTQDVIGIAIDDSKADAHYVLAFLTAEIGRLQIVRWGQGNVQQHLNMPSVRRFEWLEITNKAQQYIGGKVRQAERLRAYAMELEKQTRAVLDCVVPPFAEQARKIARITPTLLSDRIDTQPYRTHYLSLQHALSSVRCDQLSSIATARSGDPVPSDEFCSTGIPLVRIRDISEEGFASPETYVSSSYTDAKLYASAHVGDIVIGMDGEFRAQFFLDEELPQFVNQRIAIVKAHGIRPELLTVWINRIEGQYQLNRWSVKTTVDHTSLEYINMIRVPRLEPDLEEELANKLLAARLSRWFATVLTKAARVLVESLN